MYEHRLPSKNELVRQMEDTVAKTVEKIPEH